MQIKAQPQASNSAPFSSGSTESTDDLTAILIEHYELAVEHRGSASSSFSSASHNTPNGENGLP